MWNAPAAVAGILALGLAGCAEQPGPVVVPPVAPLVSTVAPIGGEECREYQSTAEIGGSQQPVHGTACRQPDGTWRIVNGQGAAAPSTQTTTTTYVYPAYDPWSAYGPWCCGPQFGGAFFLGGFHHHHHHHHHGGMHHGHH